MNYKSILITGGTGSFGQNYVRWLVKNKSKELKRLVVFSRDEMKQYEMSQQFNQKKYSFIRYFLGDVRDYKRLKMATKGIETIIHAAALKQVPASEYNPFETIKTNIVGAQNVIEAALESNVSKVIALSTDKAAAPINLYGATKLCADKLFVAANNVFQSKLNKKIFTVVRYGNVVGSRGSVIPFFLNLNRNSIYPITHKSMTRFSIKMSEAIDMINWVYKNAKGGEIFVPKIPSYRILDLLKAINPTAKYKIVGIRQGEKLHEQMITENDGFNTIDLGKYYAILQSENQKNNYLVNKKVKKVPQNFSYSSSKNICMSIKEIKHVIQDYLKNKNEQNNSL